MTNKPKQPRGLGGRFVKAGDPARLIASGNVTLGEPDAPAARKAVPPVAFPVPATPQAVQPHAVIKQKGRSLVQIIEEANRNNVAALEEMRVESAPGVEGKFADYDFLPMNETFARHIGATLPSDNQPKRGFMVVTLGIVLIGMLIVAAIAWPR